MKTSNEKKYLFVWLQSQELQNCLFCLLIEIQRATENYNEPFLNKGGHYKLNTSISQYFGYTTTRIWAIIQSEFDLQFYIEVTRAISVIYSDEQIQVLFLRRNVSSQS